MAASSLTSTGKWTQASVTGTSFFQYDDTFELRPQDVGLVVLRVSKRGGVESRRQP